VTARGRPRFRSNRKGETLSEGASKRSMGKRDLESPWASAWGETRGMLVGGGGVNDGGNNQKGKVIGMTLTPSGGLLWGVYR